MSGLGTASPGIKIPKAMERDLRHAMDLESPFCSPAMARRQLKLNLHHEDEGNEGDDEISVEEDFPFSPEECSQVAQLLGLGILSQDGATGQINFLDFKGDDNDLLDLTQQVDLNQDDLMKEMERMMDMEEGDEEMNIPWLLAAAGAGENRKGELNIPWLFAAASRGKVEQGYASLPSKLKVQHDSEDEEEEKINADQPDLKEDQLVLKEGSTDQLEKKNDKEEDIEKWALL